VGVRFQWGWVDINQHPKWVRFYQGIKKTTLPGGGDSTIWYGLFEFRATDNYAPLGQWTDDDVMAGLDTSYIVMHTYYNYQLLRNDLGDVKVLPPYNYDCQIPFSDIEYLSGQFWGIGDPDYPSRIYFSEYDWPGMNIFSWYSLDFIQIRELGNDELIAIERAEGFGADALYLFAHNSIWLMDEEGNYQAISTRVGAASRETVVKHGNTVYSLSPNLRIYALSGTQVTELSQPVENYVESVFVDWNAYGYQGFYAWAHTFGDYVRWFNDTTGMGLSFNTKSGAWTLERYGSGAYVPRGSFSYDTMRSASVSVVMTSDVELLYMDSTVSLRKADPTRTYDVGYIALERAIQSVYWTPHMTDGSRYQQVSEIDLTLNVRSSGALHYTVYNQYGDSLCADSVPLIYNDTVVHLRRHAPYNRCLRPSVKVYSNDTDSVWIPEGEGGAWSHLYHNWGLMDMTVIIQDMGAGRVQ
jgi:hypothetical protein